MPEPQASGPSLHGVRELAAWSPQTTRTSKNQKTPMFPQTSLLQKTLSPWFFKLLYKNPCSPNPGFQTPGINQQQITIQ